MPIPATFPLASSDLHDIVDQGPKASTPHEAASRDSGEHEYPFSDVQVQIEAYEIRVDPCTESTGESSEPSSTRQTKATDRRSTSRVTFRSRVRITSGLSGHRKSRTSLPKATSIPGFSPDSSRSCSPSSSISAPLRFHSEESVVKPGWGTLGQRVALFAQKKAQNRRSYRAVPQRRAKGLWAAETPCYTAIQSSETTPLLFSASNYYGAASYVCDCERCHQASTLDSEASWSQKMMDYRWWWESLQHVVTCGCLDESDEGD